MRRWSFRVVTWKLVVTTVALRVGSTPMRLAACMRCGAAARSLPRRLQGPSFFTSIEERRRDRQLAELVGEGDDQLRLAGTDDRIRR